MRWLIIIALFIALIFISGYTEENPLENSVAGPNLKISKGNLGLDKQDDLEQEPEMVVLDEETIGEVEEIFLKGDVNEIQVFCDANIRTCMYYCMENTDDEQCKIMIEQRRNKNE